MVVLEVLFSLIYLWKLCRRLRCSDSVTLGLVCFRRFVRFIEVDFWNYYFILLSCWGLMLF